MLHLVLAVTHATVGFMVKLHSNCCLGCRVTQRLGFQHV
jgi:hypothetical protein